MFSNRIEFLNEQSNTQGKYVLYWMQQAQRTLNNHALSYAIETANNRKCPLVVLFVVSRHYPNANLRHYEFMLEGLKTLKPKLEALGAYFLLEIGDAEEIVLKFSEHACCVVFDKGYLLHERKSRTNLAAQIKKEVIMLDTNCLIPVDKAYPKEAYAAYAMRPSILRQLNQYIEEVPLVQVETPYSELSLQMPYELNAFNKAEALSSVPLFMERYLGHLESLPSVSQYFQGGEDQAIIRLADFLNHRITLYDSRPDANYISRLSPYLHFGQISPLTIYLEMLKTNCINDDFVEQLIVRRELAINYVYYNSNYKGPLSLILPNWAYETLENHRLDPRVYYTLDDIEKGQTEDLYFNTAQLEMVKTGHMNGYMRMYWGKKVLEWSRTPEEAFERLIYLNDKYELDGRDANGYAGIAWIFGKHDRPWRERPIFGKIRYMNAQGLERKFDMKQYG